MVLVIDSSTSSCSSRGHSDCGLFLRGGLSLALQPRTPSSLALLLVRAINPRHSPALYLTQPFVVVTRSCDQLTALALVLIRVTCLTPYVFAVASFAVELYSTLPITLEPYSSPLLLVVNTRRVYDMLIDPDSLSFNCTLLALGSEALCHA